MLALAMCPARSFAAEPSQRSPFRLASFSADITIPLGHRCMGILPVKAKRIDDPLEAHGFVLFGSARPIVLVALDWCELRNGAYDAWRDALAEAAETDRRHVLVCCLHQHDAPVADREAQRLLDGVGMAGELYDPGFFRTAIRRVVGALREAVRTAQPVTHLGLGQARVDRIASSRRVVLPDGRITFARGSRSGSNPIFAAAPEGEIDPFLKTISFWNGDKPLLALHAYATHPMSYYGAGGVSADFVGHARRAQQRRHPGVHQIYVTGCAGDVTAGKYNDGSPGMRRVLAERLGEAMQRSWQETRRVPLLGVRLRTEALQLPFRKGPQFTEHALRRQLADPNASDRQRILAAMSLSSSIRVRRGQPIDLCSIDFGHAAIVLFPAETFVAYQLAAQHIANDRFVLCIGYGECWPGYIPTERAFDEGFRDVWMWVDRGCEPRIRAALRRLLQTADPRRH
ncbi:MAG: hypothetical protein D6725_17895 [Planctomycetota bacterium]|nr:MAG: hypothetical protein D6725_17895 [Planctomycetota bacterium]